MSSSTRTTTAPARTVRRGSARSFLWAFTPSSHALSVTRDDRRLVVTVTELPEGALTVAVDGPRMADSEMLLDRCTQRIVAERTTLATAMRRGERLARGWLAGRGLDDHGGAHG